MIARCVALMALLAFPVLAQDPEKEREAEAKKRLEEFKTKLKAAKNSDERETSLKYLGEFQHPLILKELIPYLRDPADSVKIAAGREVAKYKEDKVAGNALADVIQSLVSNPKADKETTSSMLDFFGAVGCRSLVEKIHQHVNHKAAGIAQATIDAIAAIRSTKSFDALLNFLRQLEAIQDPNKNNQGQPPGGVPGTPQIPGANQNQQYSMEQEQYQRKLQLTPRVLSALKAISGESMGTSKAYGDWWAKNGSKLKASEDKEEKDKEDQKKKR